ncbi:hypothetical protein IE81DRAFT_338801 [Ceraceosorus guamensis]|uniref:Uncharacterized protein n=1 Tax=Ceraceosorus guamensis TaxID=1522189 RepID=A0A316W972_9BASI|nr:hypothetical protein IE81DRAFT_338801 [Ceraceosorus guamensis]PWN46382.1 hypothetical protein IE81DRAFT_338801 [Ceraceosorus guamensis]
MVDPLVIVVAAALVITDAQALPSYIEDRFPQSTMLAMRSPSGVGASREIEAGLHSISPVEGHIAASKGLRRTDKFKDLHYLKQESKQGRTVASLREGARGAEVSGEEQSRDPLGIARPLRQESDEYDWEGVEPQLKSLAVASPRLKVGSRKSSVAVPTSFNESENENSKSLVRGLSDLSRKAPKRASSGQGPSAHSSS